MRAVPEVVKAAVRRFLAAVVVAVAVAAVVQVVDSRARAEAQGADPLAVAAGFPARALAAVRKPVAGRPKAKILKMLSIWPP